MAHASRILATWRILNVAAIVFLLAFALRGIV